MKSAAWLGSLLVIAMLGGLGASWPEFRGRVILCHYPLGASLFYLSATVVCSVFSGQKEIVRPWLLLPVLGASLTTPFFHSFQPQVTWGMLWGLGGITVMVFLENAGLVRRLLTGWVVIGVGGMLWWWFGIMSGGWVGARTELPQEAGCLLFVVTCGFALLVLHQQDRHKCWVVLRNLRGERILHYLGLLALGIYMSSSPLPPAPVLMAAALTVGLAWGSAIANNDVVDVEIDRWSNPDRPLVVGSWTSHSFIFLAVVQGALALAGAQCISEAFSVCTCIYLAVAFLYSTPPLRLKKYVGLSAGLIAFASLMVAVAGFVCSGEKSLMQFPAPVAWYCLAALTCGVNIKDIKDYEGDRRAGIHTFVTLLGLRTGKITIAALAAAGFLAAPGIFHRADLWLPSLLFASLAAVIITRRHFREKLVFLLYYAYFLVLIAAGLFRN